MTGEEIAAFIEDGLGAFQQRQGTRPRHPAAVRRASTASAAKVSTTV
jgi:hypothetical protein